MKLFRKKVFDEQKYYAASQWQLIGRKFRRHKLASVGLVVLGILYFCAIFCEFLAPYSPQNARTGLKDCPPQRIHIINPETGGLSVPFVYALEREVDPETLRITYTEDTSRGYPVKLFVRGDPYKMWGLFESDIHLFGVDAGGEDVPVFLFGTDGMGRDMFSRVLYSARISLSIGLVGVLISFILGCVIGGIAGYFGGIADVVVQRVIEFLLSLPTIPIWLALAAALPAGMPSTQVYFGITIILSLLGWTQLARVVRGKLMVLKDEDYVMAARLMGAKGGYIIRKHLLPGFLSYLIVQVTLSVPSMIIGEAALSFLGLGIQPPSLSWGVMLQEAKTLRVISLYPWMLIPAIFVVITVLSFNFVGDGLRDAADPYKQ